MKYIHRTLSLLLIVSLVADPTVAAIARPDIWHAASISSANSRRALFAEQALAGQVLDILHPLLDLAPQLAVFTQAADRWALAGRHNLPSRIKVTLPDAPLLAEDSNPSSGDPAAPAATLRTNIRRAFQLQDTALIRYPRVQEYEAVLPGTIRVNFLQEILRPAEQHSIDESQRIQEGPQRLRTDAESHFAAELIRYVEWPAQALVRKILSRGGQPDYSNAFGGGPKGVRWTKEGVYYFTPLKPEDYDLDPKLAAAPGTDTFSAVRQPDLEKDPARLEHYIRRQAPFRETLKYIGVHLFLPASALAAMYMAIASAVNFWSIMPEITRWVAGLVYIAVAQRLIWMSALRFADDHGEWAYQWQEDIPGEGRIEQARKDVGVRRGLQNRGKGYAAAFADMTTKGVLLILLIHSAFSLFDRTFLMVPWLVLSVLIGFGRSWRMHRRWNNIPWDGTDEEKREFAANGGVLDAIAPGNPLGRDLGNGIYTFPRDVIDAIDVAHGGTLDPRPDFAVLILPHAQPFRPEAYQMVLDNLLFRNPALHARIIQLPHQGMELFNFVYTTPGHILVVAEGTVSEKRLHAMIVNRLFARALLDAPGEVQTALIMFFSILEELSEFRILLQQYASHEQYLEWDGFYPWLVDRVLPNLGEVRDRFTDFFDRLRAGSDHIQPLMKQVFAELDRIYVEATQQADEVLSRTPPTREVLKFPPTVSLLLGAASVGLMYAMQSIPAWVQSDFFSLSWQNLLAWFLFAGAYRASAQRALMTAA